MKPRPPRLPRRTPPGSQPAHPPPARLGAGAALVVAAVPGHLLAAATIAAVIANATAWITGILAAVATLFLTLGGVRYLMAGGDPGEVEKAKTALKSAAIGYALAILAPVIVTVLKSVAGG
jgi:Type IV secretion system pilin